SSSARCARPATERDRAAVAVDEAPADAEILVPALGEERRDLRRIGIGSQLGELALEHVGRDRRDRADDVATGHPLGIRGAGRLQPGDQAAGMTARLRIELGDPARLRRLARVRRAWLRLPGGLRGWRR